MSRGIPTSAELAAAVREFLEHEVMPVTEGRLSFHARVAANVAAQLERELTTGLPDTSADPSLCAAIRDRAIPFEEAYELIRPTVVAKLRVSNPRHLLPEDR
jgi:hypothetical protein